MVPGAFLAVMVIARCVAKEIARWIEIAEHGIAIKIAPGGVNVSQSVSVRVVVRGAATIEAGDAMTEAAGDVIQNVIVVGFHVIETWTGIAMEVIARM